MLTIIKALLTIKMLGWKIRAYDSWKKQLDKRYEKILKKSKHLDSKIYDSAMKKSYVIQNIKPEETWEQRAEREALK